MSEIEKYLQLYIQKLFPQFKSPLSSRFSSLFYEMSKINIIKSENLTKIDKEKEKKDRNIEKYRINPENILNGIEKRTSIIIKEIPRAFGVLNFYKLLTKFTNQINCFFVPGFAIVKREYIYAYVNISHRKGVLDVFEGINFLRDNFKIFKGYDFSKIEIYFCKYQNRKRLMKKCNKEIGYKDFFICK